MFEVYSLGAVSAVMVLYLGHRYSILCSLFTLSVLVFVSLSTKISVWVALVFFLVYIGAVLVLFFFIYSLRSNDRVGGPGARLSLLGLRLLALRVRTFGGFN